LTRMSLLAQVDPKPPSTREFRPLRLTSKTYPRVNAGTTSGWWL
jgi:hypothetical protein